MSDKKTEVVILSDGNGEWEGFYINGTLIDEAHSISASDVLKALKSLGMVDFIEVECETEDRFPTTLPKDLKDLPGYQY